MTPLFSIARNPKQLKTKRNWLKVHWSLLLGRVYTLTLFLLIWPEVSNPQVWDRSPKPRLSTPLGAPGEGTPGDMGSGAVSIPDWGSTFTQKVPDTDVWASA